MNTTIVKRRRTIEPYDPLKLMRSVYMACLGVRTPAGEAEITAKRVEQDFSRWVRKKPEITTHDIRIRTASILHTYNPHAATLYKHHDTIH